MLNIKLKFGNTLSLAGVLDNSRKEYKELAEFNDKKLLVVFADGCEIKSTKTWVKSVEKFLPNCVLVYMESQFTEIMKSDLRMNDRIEYYE